MIGQEDDQQVLPQGRLLHLADEVANATVEVVEGVQHLIVEPVGGYVPGLMTAQRGVACEHGASCVGRVSGRLCLQVVAEGGEGDIIPHTPLGRFLFLRRVVLLPMQLLKADGHEIAVHVREVDVAPVEIPGPVAGILQSHGDAWHEAYLRGHLHDGRTGERRIAAPGAERASVGTEGVGIEIGEIDALFRQLVQLWHHILAVADILGEDASTTLEQDDYDVGALRAQQGIGGDAVGEVETLHRRMALVFAHELIVGHVEGGLLERRDKVEQGVHG